MDWSFLIDHRATLLLFAIVTGHVGQVSYGGYFHNAQMKGQRHFLRIGYLHVAISFVLIAAALVSSIILAPAVRLLDERLILTLFGLNLIQHGFFILAHHKMHSMHKCKATSSFAGKLLLIAGLASLMACVSRIVSIGILVLGFFWMYPDYLTWCLGLDTLAQSRSKWVLRRPWMWVSVMSEFCVSNLVNRLSESRRNRVIEEQNAVELARLELTAKRAVDRISAVLLWCLSVPIAVAIPVWDPKPPLLYLAIVAVPFTIAWASASWTFLQRSWCYSSLLTNLDRGLEGERDLEETIRAGRKFAMYLRDFAGESDPSESHSFSTMSLAQTTFPETRRREQLEKVLLGHVFGHIEVFGFSNYYDFVEHPTARRVNTIGDDWQPRFIRYARRASLIIVLIEHVGAGMDFELEWLGNNVFPGPVAVVTSQKCLDMLEETHGALLARARWKVELAEEGEGETLLPESLRQHVRRIKRSGTPSENARPATPGNF